jgi:hypothetical protein
VQRRQYVPLPQLFAPRVFLRAVLLLQLVEPEELALMVPVASPAPSVSASIVPFVSAEDEHELPVTTVRNAINMAGW